MNEVREQFEELLSVLKDQMDLVSTYEGYEPEISEQEEFIYRIGRNIPLAIQIMESGIFREGRLQGRKISTKHRLYAIDGIEEFVIELVRIFTNLTKMMVQKQSVTLKFDSILAKYDELTGVVLECKGVRPQKVQAIRQDLALVKKKTLSKLNPISSLPPDIISSLIFLFKKYIPTAPNQTIATRISDLLKIVGFQVNQETIRKKLQTQIPTI
jgi:hypothetical protein